MLIHGGWATAIYSIMAWISSQPQSLKIVVGLFMGNGGLRAAQYFMNNPLPPEEDLRKQDGTASSCISLNPLAKVKTPEPPPK